MLFSLWVVLMMGCILTPSWLITSLRYSRLEWCHNERGGISNDRRHDCLLNRLSRHRSQRKSTLSVTGHCEGNSPGTRVFPAQRANNADNVSIWWRHHESSFNFSNPSPVPSIKENEPIFIHLVFITLGDRAICSPHYQNQIWSIRPLIDLIIYERAVIKGQPSPIHIF